MQNLIQATAALYSHLRSIDQKIVVSRFPQIAADRIDALVPRSGVVVDLGCGRGELLNYLKLSSDDRDCLGVDLAEGKVKIASETITNRTNIRFQVADVTEFKLPRANAIIISQVLYLLEGEDQIALIERCSKALEPGGVLILSLFLGERKTAWIHRAFRWSDVCFSFCPKFVGSKLKCLREQWFGARASNPTFRSPEEYAQIGEGTGLKHVQTLLASRGEIPEVVGGSGAVVVFSK